MIIDQIIDNLLIEESINKDTDGNVVYYEWQLRNLIKRVSRIMCEKQKQECADKAELLQTYDDKQAISDRGQEILCSHTEYEYIIDKSSILNCKNVCEL